MADNPRQELYLEISRNLEVQELTDLRNYVSGAKILSARFVQKADPHQICNQLEKEQKLKPGDLTLLADLLRKIGRHVYAEKAEKIAEDERKYTKTRKKRKRKRKRKQSREEDSEEESSSVGNDPHIGPVPNHTYFSQVAKAVASCWVTFAEEQLGLTAQDIHAIQLRQPYSKQHQALQALELWRDRRGRKACRVKLAEALKKGGFQHTAEELETYTNREVKMSGLHAENTPDRSGHIPDRKVSNGMKQRVVKKQRTEENGSGTQHLNDDAENGSVKKQTASRSCQGHATSGSSEDSSEEDSQCEKCTAGSDTFQQSNIRLKRKKRGKKNWQENNSVKRKKVKNHDSRDTTDGDQSYVNGNIAINDTKSAIHSTFLRIHEKVFDEKTVQDDYEFERCMDSMKKIESVISDSEDEQRKLQSAAKLRIKKRVNNKIAEVAENMFSDSVLDPANRETFHKVAECFKRYAASVKKARRGCVLCYLDFSEVGCYETFWRGYSDGSLSDTLTRELITDDMRAAEGGADLYIHVRVLDSATEDGDFLDQDPSGTAGRGPPHPGASWEHSGQGPPAPGSSNHGDDTPTGYHGDDTGGQQVSGGDDVIQVKQEPAEQVPSCCMTGTVKTDVETNGLEVKEESELDRQFADIADHLGSMWERLASSLGFNTNYIRDLTARLPPSLRPHQLICDWMERNVGDVTLEQLVQALRDAGIHEVADAADSGQLFLTEADLEAAKGKPDGDIDTGRADGEDSSNDRSSHDSQTSALASDGSHGNMEGEPMSEEDESRSSNSDTDDDGSGASSLPATCISTDIETNLPDDNVLLGNDTSKDCHTSDSDSRSAAGDVEDPAEAEVSAEKHTQDHGHADTCQPDQVQKTVAGTSVDAHKNQVPESTQATGTCKRTMQPEYRYTCSACENYNLCVVCYKKKGHSHEMQWGLQPSDVDTLQPSLSYHEARRQSIERCIQALIHACQCRDTDCSLPKCQTMKRVVQHTKSCKRRTNSGCPICKQLIALCCYHAKHCQEQRCPVPFCLPIKHKLRQKQLQQRLQQALMLRERMATMARALHQDNVKGKQVNMPQCTFTSTLYPTGEDALAWNDCIEDFFKTDEDTARSIQLSWPSNLLVKHLIRDRFFHSYLCEYWKQYQSFPDTLSIFLEFVAKVCARKFSQSFVREEEFESAYENLLVLGKTAYENELNNQQCLVHPSQLEWDDIHQSSLGLLQPISQDHDDTGSFQFVHDSLRQFLIAKCVVHMVTTNTNGGQQLRDFVKKSAALPLSRYCVAHLLGQSDRDHLLQFVNLLIQSDAELLAFDHKLHVVTATVESKQVDLLTPVLEALFPEKALDLVFLPAVSFHGLHSLSNFMSKTRVIEEIKLPSTLKVDDFLKMYPFRKSKAVKDANHHEQIRCLSYLPLFHTKTRDVGTLCFKNNDKALQIDQIQMYLLHCPSLQTLSSQKEGIHMVHFSKIAPYFLFTPSLTNLVVRGDSYWGTRLEEIHAGMKCRRCLESCKNMKILKLRYNMYMVELPTLPLLEEIDLSHNSGLVIRGIGSCQSIKRVTFSYNNLNYMQDILPPLLNLEDLNLSHNDICSKAVPSLAEGLALCQKLKKLNLSYNQLSDRGDFLPPLPNLEEIDLSHNAISDAAVPGLAKGLGSCQNLKHVHLSNNQISDKGALILLLQDQCKRMQMETAGNNISDDLMSLLSNRQNASQVTKLFFMPGKYPSRNVTALNFTAVNYLLQFLPQLPNLQELALCVSCQEEEEADLIDQLYEVQTRLKFLRLTLRDCSIDKMRRLLTPLLKQFPVLEAIDLSGSDISDEKVPALVQGFASCQKLKKVNLSHNKLSDRGDFLPPLPNLEETDLSHNAISDEAVPGLAEGLGSCQNLKKVNLSHNKLSDRGDFLPPLPNLEEIDLSHNAISDQAVSGLAEGLGSCQNLKKVNLSHNNLSDRARGEFLPLLPNLEEIDLSDNAISDELVADFVKGIFSCQNLKNVCLTNNKISSKGALLLLLQDQCKDMQIETAGNNINEDLVFLLYNRQNACQLAKLFLMSGKYPWGLVAHPLPLTVAPLLLQFLPQLPNLQELALCVSCQGEEEAEHMDQFYEMQPPLKSLRIMIMNCSLEKMTMLLTLMLQQFPLLEAINLSGSDIGDEAVPALKQGLASCQNLKNVNLSFNKLSNRGDFLPPLPNLEEINLSNSAISDEAVPGLAQCLGLCQNLKEVNLSSNKLSCVKEMIEAFVNLPFLTRVDIHYNSISDESLPTIATWLKVRTDVERVNLNSNRFSTEGVRGFVRTMKGKAYYGDTLLYDGSQAEVGAAVESGGEDVRREEQQWERLRGETWIDVKVGQLRVVISHKGRRSNNL